MILDHLFICKGTQSESSYWWTLTAVGIPFPHTTVILHMALMDTPVDTDIALQDSF